MNFMASSQLARCFLQCPLLRLYTTSVQRQCHSVLNTIIHRSIASTIREQLTAGVKNALKNKEPFTPTLLRVSHIPFSVSFVPTSVL